MTNDEAPAATQRPHAGVEPMYGSLGLIGLPTRFGLAVPSTKACDLPAAALLTWALEEHTAFSIFFRFHIPNFDRFFGFFSLCHFLFLSYLGLVCRFIVLGTLKSN